MKRQSIIDNYFKTKSATPSVMNFGTGISPKKRSLSLKKPATPAKSPKVNPESTISRNEKICTSYIDDNERQNTKDYSSDSSQNTIIYALTPNTPRSYSVGQSTPILSSPTSSRSPIKILSPRSINKYYSPTKKRAITKKIKKRINFPRELSNSCQIRPNDSFQAAIEGVDDKTKLLLSLVNKYFQDESLMRLMDKESQVLLERCFHIMKPGMVLVCRLYWYIERWYRRKALKQILSKNNAATDDPTLHKVLASLCENEFLVSDEMNGQSKMNFDDYVKVLSADDLKNICKELKLKCKKKSDSVTALKNYSKTTSIIKFYNRKQSDNSHRVLTILKKTTGPCFRLSDELRSAIHKLYVLMYLGIDYSLIRDKKLELTLIYEKQKIETYPVDNDEVLDNATVVFRNCEDFERYLEALKISENYLNENDNLKKCEIISEVFKLYKKMPKENISRYETLQPWLRRFTPANFYVKILENGIQHLKREQQYDLSLDILSTLISQNIFRQHKKADWYAERSLVLQKCDRCDEAVSTLLEGFKSDLAEEAKDGLRARAKILLKKVNSIPEKNELLEISNKDNILESNVRGVHVHKQPMDRIQSKGKLKYEMRTADGRSMLDVEDFCISHYIGTGEFTHGKHWEGKIVTTIFFLLFWDIIYSKPPNCPGIFLTRFQKFPMDYYCSSFYENRKQNIDDRLNIIRTKTVEEILEMMSEIFKSRPAGEQSGLNIDSISWEQVQEVVECLGGESLSALCSRLAHRTTASAGFPDITLWHREKKRIKFVEAKSDTDKPSMRQIQWMHYLQAHGIETEFCYVGVHTTRNKARAH